MLVIYIKQVRTPVRVVPFILALKENGNVTRTARRPVQLRLPRLSGPLDARRAMLRVYLRTAPQGRGNGGQAAGRTGEAKLARSRRPSCPDSRCPTGLHRWPLSRLGTTRSPQHQEGAREQGPSVRYHARHGQIHGQRALRPAMPLRWQQIEELDGLGDAAVRP